MTTPVGNYRSASQAMDREHQQLMERLEQVAQPALLTHTNGVVIGANSRWQSLVRDLGLPRPESGTTLREVLHGRLDPRSQATVETAVRQLLRSELTADQLEVGITSATGLMNFRIGVLPLLDQWAQVTAGIWTFDSHVPVPTKDISRLHSEKMQMISRLAGGIAHEFNNLLTVVIGNMEVARILTDESVACHLDAADTAAQRATTLIQEMRHFGTRSQPVIRSQAVGPILKRAAEELEDRAPADTVVVCDLEQAEDLHAAFDAELLSDCLQRIGRNSVEALESSGGLIQLSACVVSPVSSPDMLRIQVRDNGPGLSLSSNAMAFEPFVSTRKRSSNPGLGLAIAYGLIEEMNGHIEIATRRSGGTVVTIHLPQTVKD